MEIVKKLERIVIEELPQFFIDYPERLPRVYAGKIDKVVGGKRHGKRYYFQVTMTLTDYGFIDILFIPIKGGELSFRDFIDLHIHVNTRPWIFYYMQGFDEWRWVDRPVGLFKVKLAEIKEAYNEETPIVP